MRQALPLSPTPKWKYAMLMLWVIVPMIAYGIYLTSGAPHLLVSYRYHDNGDVFNPLAARSYTQCSYVGWGLSEITTLPVNGRCPLIRFFKFEGGAYAA